LFLATIITGGFSFSGTYFLAGFIIFLFFVFLRFQKITNYKYIISSTEILHINNDRIIENIPLIHILDLQDVIPLLNHVDFGMLKITLHDNTSKTIPFLDDATFVKEFILSHLPTE